MLLYQFRMGTNPRRVIVYLTEKGIDVPRYELDYAKPAPSQDVARKTQAYVEELLDVLEATIGSNAFLAGDNPTIADCTVFPVFQTARERCNLHFRNAHPRLGAWYRRFRARPSGEY